MLATIVQHHPARSHLLPELLDRLPADAIVVTDPEPDEKPNPWRCYRECLLAIPDEATHALIVQDDATPHHDFREVVGRCIEARPNRIICYFVAGQPARGARNAINAQARRLSWAELSHTDFLPVVATSWPTHAARDFLQWAERYAQPRHRSDDGLAGRWIRERAVRPLATVPCLVDHLDVERSLIGKQALAGRNPARVAVISPDGHDILSIDWT